MDSATTSIRCRPVGPDDLDAVLRLVVQGFPARSAADWARGFDRLRAYHDGLGDAHFGHLIEQDGRVGGVLLSIPDGRVASRRRNLSTWYVRPELRSYAPLLVRAASRDRDITYLNISPEPSTRRTIEALGFRRYGPGTFLCVPLLGRDRVACRVLAPSASDGDLPGASPDERTLVRRHAALGCLAFWCVAEGRAHPFVVVRRPRVRGIVPCAQLVYCADTHDVARFARSLGRKLLSRGFAALAVDAEGPIPGLVGRFVPDQGVRYFKGPARPRLGDLAYSEAVLFGL